jgi:hypothetical protein
MRKIMLACMVLAAGSPATAAERRYTITDFDRVQVDGPFEVTLAIGKSSAASASGSPDELARVSVEVQGRTLRIRPNASAWGGYPGDSPGSASLTIVTRRLLGAGVRGSGSLAIDGAEGMRIDLQLSGNGKLAATRLAADELIVSASGGGKIVIAGAAKKLRASIMGSADFDGKALIVEDGDVVADTAGAVALTIRRTAKIMGRGSGDTIVAGKPACTVSMMGAGRIQCSGTSDQRQD